MGSVASSWKAIEEVLYENSHSVFLSLRKPASDSQIARMSKLLRAKLPRDYLQSLKVHDGLEGSYLGQVRLFDDYALLPVSAVVSEYQSMCSLQADCGFSGSLVGCDPEIRNDAHWQIGWVPIMDADGDKIVIDLNPTTVGSVGQIFAWSNAGSTQNKLLAHSYKDWLAGLARSLSQREFRFDEYGGIWLNQE